MQPPPMSLAAAWEALLIHCRGSASMPAGRVTPAADLAELTETAAAEALTERYGPLACSPTGRPLVIAQLGQSLDGRIATPNGHSHYVTSAADRAHLHRLRALSEAVLVGARTVAADDPALTVRAVSGPNPVRVVVCERGGLDPDRRPGDRVRSAPGLGQCRRSGIVARTLVGGRGGDA